jgi:2-oxoisovalerate dehydrogenase E1 component
VVSTDDLVEMRRRMRVIRRSGELKSRLYADAEVPDFVHVSIGQEATAVGRAGSSARTTAHGRYGHCLDKGLEPELMFAELKGGRPT